jgi:putative transposase
MAMCCKGAHFPNEVLLVEGRWYVASPLSPRHVAALMEERGVSVDYATINRWVIKYSPHLAEEFPRRKRPGWLSGRLDETYLRVTGEWKSRARGGSARPAP